MKSVSHAASSELVLLGEEKRKSKLTIVDEQQVERMHVADAANQSASVDPRRYRPSSAVTPE